MPLLDAEFRLRFPLRLLLRLHRLLNALCGVFMLPFSFSSSSARDLQYWTWRLRCCLLEVCIITPGVSHRLDHLYLSWHLWSHDSFSAQP